MKDVYLFFPGQGSQYPGMAKGFQNTEQWSIWENADSSLDFPLSKICLEGSEQELKKTEITQPAIVTHSIALFEKVVPILHQMGFSIKAVLGHSVGEYSALVAAGSLSFSEAVKAVNQRGKFMQQAVPEWLGGMLAIVRCPQEKVIEACQLAFEKTGKSVSPANFNSPDQVVISGEKEALDYANQWLKEQGEKRMRSIPLAVSAPFHSSLMKPAADNLAEYFKSIDIKENALPYIANIDAKLYPSKTSGQTIKDNLISQVAGSVLWTQSIQKLPDDASCLEVGPGKVLTGLARKINKKLKVQSLDQQEDWHTLLEALA